MRRWGVGLAMLSVSWLYGLELFTNNLWWMWGALLLGAVPLLAHIPMRSLTRNESLSLMALVIPTLYWIPWPYAAIAWLIILGSLLAILPVPRQWPQNLGTGCLWAALLLLAHALGVMAYVHVTARSHELPQVWAQGLCLITRMMGIDVALDGGNLVMHTSRTLQRLGATWELLLDPTTLCFGVGGLVLLFYVGGSRPAEEDSERDRYQPWFPALAFTALMIVWIPLRFALLLGIFLQRDFRAEYYVTAAPMNQFWSPWMAVLLLAGPLLIWMSISPLIRRPEKTTPEAAPIPPRKMPWLSPLLMGLGIALLTFGGCWDPPGPRQAGRVLVDEFHSEWEPTQRPYDVNWYGPEAGYNYAAIYDYCSRFYDMSQQESPLDANALSSVDVLMLKIPTKRFDPEEINAIVTFVEQGGGVLMIGDHTDVFTSSTCLNDIAQHFGFTFRHDYLWDIESAGYQVFQRPWIPHPIVQHMPDLNFAVGCSIAPGTSTGQAVMLNTGLKNFRVDYHPGNFMSQSGDSADMRYGAFVQLWSTRYGRGRVAAFTDSTIFSNFATFEPGKPELMLGMLEWLNHRNGLGYIRFVLIGLGGLLVGAAAVLAFRLKHSTMLLIGAGWFAWMCAGVCTAQVHRITVPAPEAVRPYVKVVVDQTVCQPTLSSSGVITGQETGFGIFERWILRLGYFTARQKGPDAFSGDVLLLCYPNQRITAEFRDRVLNYVEQGGKLLVLDAPENQQSTSNSLLYPFGLSLMQGSPLNGTLTTPKGWPQVPVTSAWRIQGGNPIFTLKDIPVGAQVQYGQGTVAVLGFGSRFTDANMGKSSEIVPDEETRKIYDLEFSLIRAIVENKLIKTE